MYKKVQLLDLNIKADWWPGSSHTRSAGKSHWGEETRSVNWLRLAVQQTGVLNNKQWLKVKVELLHSLPGEVVDAVILSIHQPIEIEPKQGTIYEQ